MIRKLCPLLRQGLIYGRFPEVFAYGSEKGGEENI